MANGKMKIVWTKLKMLKLVFKKLNGDRIEGIT